MNPLKNILILSVLAFFFVGAGSFVVYHEKQIVKNKLVIRFHNYVGTDKLVLDSVVYKNALGQAYTISMFKYYVGNIRLKRNGGPDYISHEYFLLDEDNSQSEQLILNDIPEGDYNSLSFMVGVDSLHNCSGVQSGALDPVKGMFWTWNTGYIFLKIEGHTSFSKSPGHIFEFHIGGFKGPANCIRNINLDLKNKNLKVAAGKTSSLEIKTDASEIFKGPVTIDFSKNSSITDMHNAKMIADNYIDMFSIL